jgi:Kef-type K+ transport system membrane component KefB
MTHLLQLLLALALIVAAAKLSGAAANRVGQPAVFGEILAGLVLGPTVLDMLAWAPFVQVLPAAHGSTPALIESLRDLAELGVILLMFVAGLETDLAEMRRVGTVALWTAFGGVLMPLVAGSLTATLYGLPLFWTGIFIGTILTATSVSISAQTLMELNAPPSSMTCWGSSCSRSSSRSHAPAAARRVPTSAGSSSAWRSFSRERSRLGAGSIRSPPGPAGWR